MTRIRELSPWPHPLTHSPTPTGLRTVDRLCESSETRSAQKDALDSIANVARKVRRPVKVTRRCSSAEDPPHHWNPRPWFGELDKDLSDVVVVGERNGLMGVRCDADEKSLDSPSLSLTHLPLGHLLISTRLSETEKLLCLRVPEITTATVAFRLGVDVRL